MAYVITTAVGLLFGAGMQYLGSLTAGSVLGTWTWTVSGMSAPWLVLPFVVGMTQDRLRRAMALGLVVTLAALAGYFAMAHSPLEGAPLRDFLSRVLMQVRTGSNLLWIAAGMVTGPLFGLLGHRWRVARSPASAALLTVALCFEPVARLVVGMLSGRAVVWASEVGAGIVVAALFALAIVTSRRPNRTVPLLPPNA